jgi:type IX secretion system PorP/SprF family membrane protein
MEITYKLIIKQLFFLLLLPLSLSAQQDPLYSMYLFNPLSINPAYSGSTNQFQAVGLYRRQWMKFPGSPGTSTCTVHGPVNGEKMGVGISFINDQVGYMKTTSFMATYAYKLKLENSTLAFGLQTGFRNFNVSLTEVQVNDQDDYDVAFANNFSSWNLNFGTGVFWFGEKWYGGIGIPHLRNHLLRENELNYDDVARLRTHYNIYGGYVFDLASNLKIRPSMLIRKVKGAPYQFDINANLLYLDLYSLGISYRTSSSLMVLAEVKMTKNFRLGYATDFTINKLRGQTGATHEIMLRYDFLAGSAEEFTIRYF